MLDRINPADDYPSATQNGVLNILNNSFAAAMCSRC
jgi:hypothetical protein